MTKSTSDLVQALDACLAGMSREGLDPRSAAGRHPEGAEELLPLLELASQLGTQPAIPAATETFRRKLARDLAAAPAPRALRARRDVADRTALWRRVWRSTAFGAAAAGTVIAFLAIGAVRASAASMPGDWLYGVKRTVEGARLRLAGDELLAFHLAYADRRLNEAAGAPEYGGILLADFSREVTAALVEADRLMAAGRTRSQVVDPLLMWLLDQRGRLVEARPGLPPTAWRATLALVDEAIAALRSGGPLSVAPVPRLADASAVLDQRWLSSAPWVRADVTTAPAIPGSAGRTQRQPIANRAVAAGGPNTDTDHMPRSESGIVGTGAGATGPAATAPATQAIAPTTQESRRSEPSPDPSQPPERGHEPPPTDPPAEPEAPTGTATPAATSALAPTDPPSPTATEPATPLVPTPTPSAAPSPTVAPVNQPPEITHVGCYPTTVEVYGESTCSVDVEDPEGDALSYAWYADWGLMKHADKRVAVFQAVLSIGGISKFDVPVRVTVRDASGNEASEETVVIVVPRVKMWRNAPLLGRQSDRPLIAEAAAVRANGAR